MAFAGHRQGKETSFEPAHLSDGVCHNVDSHRA